MTTRGHGLWPDGEAEEIREAWDRDPGVRYPGPPPEPYEPSPPDRERDGDREAA
jgi:hypothetical protein